MREIITVSIFVSIMLVTAVTYSGWEGIAVIAGALYLHRLDKTDN